MTRPALRELVRACAASLAGAALLTTGLAGLRALDRAYPPPLDPPALSKEVVDRDGRLLRAFAAPDGRWRLPAPLTEVDPDYVTMLIAYEDRRFWSHRGIDVQALARATAQLLANGRIVSGASTLSMQLARLLEPRAERSLTAKLRQMARAVQIERRLGKTEILERYLALAPYGGNLEGVRAASLAWFGKEPKRLTLSEAALLVALPQSPEARRPDRHPERARMARDRVLARMAAAGRIAETEIARAGRVAVPTMRRALPALAPHATQDAVAAAPAQRLIRLSLRRTAQENLEQVARTAAARLGTGLSVAIVMADAWTGEIVGEVGSAEPFDDRRAGWIDMTRVERSPGSTLKPFIYGLAFEEGLVAQETVIADRPADFAGYRPKNFDTEYQGDVTVRAALQMSLNVPAIKLLDEVGPVRLATAFRKVGAPLSLPKGETPGLAIGLGGAGMTLRGLVQLYTSLANGGEAVTLTREPGVKGPRSRLLDRSATWQIADILSGVKPPQGAPDLGLAYKTGTSYGYRDAWSIGFDGRHVLGVWIGRPDGGWSPDLTGYASAAPVLFEAFSRSGVARVARAGAPEGARRLAAADLPVTQRRFVGDGRHAPGQTPEAAPRFLYPPDGAQIELGLSSSEGAAPLVVKLQGGRAPFRWLANGKPLEVRGRRRETTWRPDGAGYSTLTVIDASGRAASIGVYVR